MKEDILQLNAAARALRQEGRLGDAVKAAEQAVKLAESYYGSWHSEYVTNLSVLATLCEELGDYTRAEPLYLESCSLAREVFGRNNLEYAIVLSNLALFYETLGRYRDSLQLCLESLEIKRECVGEDHPSFGMSLNNLGGVYEEMGFYPQAEEMYRRAVEVFGAALGTAHSDYAMALGNLGVVLAKMGELQRAEELLKQAMEINKAIFGLRHTQYGADLNTLALLRWVNGEYDQAISMFQTATEILREALGQRHQQYATALHNLGLAFWSKGLYAEAKKHLRESLDITRRVLGDNHKAVALYYTNLGSLLCEIGEDAEGEKLLEKALRAYKTCCGEENTAIVQPLCRLAAIAARWNQILVALQLLGRATNVEDRVLSGVVRSANERQRTAFIKELYRTLDVLLSVIIGVPQRHAEMEQLAFKLILRRKAIGTEVLAAQRDTVLGGKYPALKSKLQELTKLHMQIAQKTLAGHGPEGLPAHRQVLAEWNAQKERLEAELAWQIPEMNLEQTLQTADQHVVAQRLSEGMVLIEFIRFNLSDFKAVPARGEPQRKPARYLAFVLPAGEPDNLQMIDLGEAGPIDQMIATFRAEIIGEAESRARRDLGALPNEPVGEPGISDGTALCRALFDPLLRAIGNRKRLLLAPDGDLTRLPFEVLPTGDGRRLIDDYRISYLSTGRDVLRFGAASSAQPSESLVAADPDFDLSGGQAQAQLASETVATASRGRVSRDLDRSHLHFPRLPGTHVEGERIGEMLNVQPWLSDQALEARLKACRSPRILHLATHGFFLADQPRDPNRELRDLGALGWQAGGGWAGLIDTLRR